LPTGALGVQEIIIPTTIDSKVLIGDLSGLPEKTESRKKYPHRFEIQKVKQPRRGMQGGDTSHSAILKVALQAISGRVLSWSAIPVRHQEINVARDFKVRSPERDARTDTERFGALARSVSSAMEAVRAERNALKIRVDEARDRAALVAGTDNDEYLARDDRDAAHLRAYEQEMMAGDLRLKELERQLDGLNEVSQAYERFFLEFAAVKPR
jgi:hypothetical protein